MHQGTQRERVDVRCEAMQTKNKKSKIRGKKSRDDWIKIMRISCQMLLSCQYPNTFDIDKNAQHSNKRTQ